MLNFTYYTYQDKEKNCPAVKAVSTYAGKSVYGIAYLHPDDTFDEELGKAIARYRCVSKIIEKKYKNYAHKLTIIREDMLYLVEELERLHKVVSRYEKVLSETSTEGEANEAALKELLAKIS